MPVKEPLAEAVTDTPAADTVDTSTESVEAVVDTSTDTATPATDAGPSTDDVIADEPATGTDTPATEVDDAEDAIDENPWNGEISALDKVEGWSDLTPALQKKALAGFDTVRRNMDRAFHSKTQVLAERAKLVDEQAKLVIQLATGEADFEGTIDTLVESRLEERLATRTEEIRRELAEAKAGEQTPAEVAEIQSRLEATKAELDKALDENEQWRSVAQQSRSKQVDNMVNEANDYLAANAPDILKNPEALERFFNSQDSFIDNEAALATVRIKYPAPSDGKVKGTEPEEPPKVFDLEEPKKIGDLDPAEAKPFSMDQLNSLMREEMKKARHGG